MHAVISWINTKFGVRMFDIYDQIAEEFKFLNYFMAQTKELRSLKTVKNYLFKLFFYPLPRS